MQYTKLKYEEMNTFGNQGICVCVEILRLPIVCNKV